MSRTLLPALLIALYTICAVIYAGLIPVYEGFDAQSHFAAIQYLRSERSLPVLSPALVERSYELVPHPPLYYAAAAVAASGLPLEGASQAAQRSVNAYFDKSLSARQSVTLADLAWPDLAPAWVARAVAALGGLLLVVCTWWTARRLFPAHPTFALAAGAIAGLNPQFLFTAVTISNDAWAAGTAALALAAAVDVVVAGRRPRSWLWVGLALGVAALTKYSTLALLLPLAILYLLYWRRQGGRAALAAFGFAAFGFAALAGWWFVRNWLLYGEIVPLNRMAEVLPSMRRAQPYSWQQTWAHVPWLVASFWGVFVAVITPPLYLDSTRWFLIGGLLGLLPAVWQMRRDRLRDRGRHQLRGWPVEQVILYAVLLPWLGAVAASVLYWTRTIEYGEQGRLAHIGASAFGVLMAAGWQGWFPNRWRTALHWLLTAAALAAALALMPFLQAQFGLPPALAADQTAPDRVVDARFAGGMRVLGVDLPAGAAIEPGKPLPLTIYFSTDAPIAADYTLFLHVADAQNRLLYQFDGVPLAGRHPTRQWLPGQVFADSYTIRIDELPDDLPDDLPGGAGTGAGELATLSLGFYPLADREARVAVYDSAGQPIGDRLVLAQLRLHAQEPAQVDPVDNPAGVWRNGIVLAAAAPISDTQGQPLGVTLTWQPQAIIQQEYTVFVQVLGADDEILAQVDSRPQGGGYPTSTWRAGDMISDTLRWSGDGGRSDDVNNWRRIIVGLYGDDGVRLPLIQPPGDAVEIARR